MDGPTEKLLAVTDKKGNPIRSRSGDHHLRLSSEIIEAALPFSVEDLEKFMPAAKRPRISEYESSGVSFDDSIGVGGSAGKSYVLSQQSSSPFPGQEIPTAPAYAPASSSGYLLSQGYPSPSQAYGSWQTETPALGDEPMYGIQSGVQPPAALSSQVRIGINPNWEDVFHQQQQMFEASYALGDVEDTSMIDPALLALGSSSRQEAGTALPQSPGLSREKSPTFPFEEFLHIGSQSPVERGGAEERSPLAHSQSSEISPTRRDERSGLNRSSDLLRSITPPPAQGGPSRSARSPG